MNGTIVPIIAGNWKMNGLIEQLAEISNLDNMLEQMQHKAGHIIICPPATLLNMAKKCAKYGQISFGGQNCHWEERGAHTGDISAEMLADCGALYVILGHSERRMEHGETDEIVQKKVGAAFRAKLTPIICVGESEKERKANMAVEKVLSQIKNSLPSEAKNNKIIIAYEPIWAIGTGLVPTLDEIKEMHQKIREQLVNLFGEHGMQYPILYGGSMKPDNAKNILSIKNVNGGLVGGASLKTSEFIKIIKALDEI